MRLAALVVGRRRGGGHQLPHGQAVGHRRAAARPAARRDRGGGRVPGGRARPGSHRRRLGDGGRHPRGHRRRRRRRSRSSTSTRPSPGWRPPAGRGRSRPGPRSSARLFARATPAEAAFLRRLLVGELRQGALEGVMADAIAEAAAVPATVVRRAMMLSGDIRRTGRVALTEGRAGLEADRPHAVPAGAADAGVDGRGGRRRADRRPGRRRWSGSSTAPASRCTARATSCGSTPATSTR